MTSQELADALTPIIARADKDEDAKAPNFDAWTCPANAIVDFVTICLRKRTPITGSMLGALALICGIMAKKWPYGCAIVTADGSTIMGVDAALDAKQTAVVAHSLKPDATKN